ncbi:MAG TPA: PIN domain-containing protein [Thermoanaerobaculia bacterium]|nr:PIN domain-containing protein [Thermoanaerobaculia bacterium]
MTTARRVLVDTSAWIEALRPDGDDGVRREVREALEEGAAAFCDLVLLELWNGARGEAEREYLAQLEAELVCLPTTPEVWRDARELARACRAAGANVPATDLLIAACAGHHGAGLLHRDRHLELIARAAF